MKLQGIIQNNYKYDSKRIAEDVVLTKEIQEKLIDFELLDPPVDGSFGTETSEALHRFQILSNCSEPEYLGPETARNLLKFEKEDILSVGKLSVKATQDTKFKNRPIDSSNLEEEEKEHIPKGKVFELISCEVTRNQHLRIVLRNNTISGKKIWYAFVKHIEVYTNNECIVPKQKPDTIQLSIPYKSQLDNQYNPTGACNVTSLAMCLQYLEISGRNNQGQFEDELYQYAIDNGYSRHSPYDLAKIAQDYGAKDSFRKDGSIEEAKDWLASKNPVIIHGFFTNFGHIIVLTGYNENGFLVHDPYGEWFADGYRTDLNGKFLLYSYNLIRKTCIPDGNLWAHFISK